MKETDMFILGKGPAGIQASIYAKRANLEPLVVGKDLGMCLKAKTVENFYGTEIISGSELVENGITQAQNLGIEVLSDEVVSLSFGEDGFIVKSLNETYLAKTFLFASGTHRNVARIRGINRYEGKGVSYCAVCDAFFYRNKTVAVLGHSEYAASEVSELVEVCDTVYVLTNGQKIDAEFDARAIIVEDKILQVSGEDKVEKVHFEDHDLDVSGIFVALGTASSTDLAQKIGVAIERDRIIVNDNMETNIPGLYAAGDCTPGYQQIAKAIGDGCVAGMSMAQYVRRIRRNKKTM